MKILIETECGKQTCYPCCAYNDNEEQCQLFAIFLERGDEGILRCEECVSCFGTMDDERSWAEIQRAMRKVRRDTQRI